MFYLKRRLKNFVFLGLLVVSSSTYSNCKDRQIINTLAAIGFPGFSEILNSEKNDWCESPEIGEVRKFDLEKEQSLTGIRHKYNLKRIDENKYEIIINPKFMLDSTVGKPKVRGVYWKRT